MSLEVIKRNIEQEKETLEVHSKVISLFNSIVKEKQTQVLVAWDDVTDEMTRVFGCIYRATEHALDDLRILAKKNRWDRDIPKEELPF